MSSYLTELVRQHITELGAPQAAEFFQVSEDCIRLWLLDAKFITLSAVEKVFSKDKLLADHGRMIQAQWEGKQVAILLPFQKQTNPLTTFSLMTMIDRAKMATMMRFGDAFIIHTRNNLTAQWRKSKIPWGLTVDDDMILPCGLSEWYNEVTEFDFAPEYAGVHAVNRLLESGKTLIGGLYFGRSKSRRPMVGGMTDPQMLELAHSAPHNLVKEVPWVATGALLHHAKVFDDIEAGYPELAPQMAGDTWHFFSPSETELTKATDQVLMVLNDARTSETARLKEAERLLRWAKEAVATSKRLRFGEDVTFCKRAASVGHPAHVDFGVVCGHVGTHVYGPKRTAIA